MPSMLSKENKMLSQAITESISQLFCHSKDHLTFQDMFKSFFTSVYVLTLPILSACV